MLVEMRNKYYENKQPKTKGRKAKRYNVFSKYMKNCALEVRKTKCIPNCNRLGGSRVVYRDMVCTATNEIDGDI